MAWIIEWKLSGVFALIIDGIKHVNIDEVSCIQIYNLRCEAKPDDAQLRNADMPDKEWLIELEYWLYISMYDGFAND